MSTRFLTQLNVGLLIAAFATLSSCGKVSNLSEQAGIDSGAYIAVTLDPKALLAATVNVPYKEVPKVNGGILPFHFAIAEGGLPKGLSLDPDTGVISGIVPDTEVGKQSDFSLTIMDGNQLADTKNYSIKVNPYQFTIEPEELPTIIPHQAYQVKFSVVGAIDPVKYAFVGSLPTGLTFDAEKQVLTADDLIAALDTSKSAVTVTLSATDSNGVTSTRDYAVKVAASTYSSISLAEKTLTQIPVEVEYKDVLIVKGGVGPFVFKITQGALPTGLTLAEDTGIISGKVESAAYSSPQGSFGVEVTDSYGLKSERAYAYTLTPYAIAVSPTDVPSIVPTLPFSMQFSTVGGKTPITYKLSGTLPGKLRLTLDGKLETFDSNVPPSDASSTWPVEVTATDANGIEGSVSLVLKVGNTPANSSPLAIQTNTLTPMIAGSAYSAGISTTGGVAPLSYAIQSGALPTGLTLAPATGLITGNLPFGSAGAAYAIVVQVIDANGSAASKTYSGNVAAGSNTLSIRSTLVSTPVAGGDYSSVIAISGGLSPYVFTVSSGTLPSGLSLNASTGVISGTAGVSTAGQTFLFTISVADSAAQTDSKAYSGTIGSVLAPLTIQTASLVTPISGSNYAAGVVASGGVVPLTYAIQSGALPTGLTLDGPTGVITGSLAYSTAGTSYAVTLKVTDSAGQVATKSYSGTVSSGAPTLNIVSPTLATPVSGSAYNAVVAVTGGVTPYTFSVNSGTLPAGLSLSSTTGLISGTPTYASSGATYDYFIKVVDTSGQQAIREYSGSVGAITPALAIQTPTIPAPVAGAAYAAGVSVTNGVPALTFSILSGTLPTGLSLNTATGVISGSVPYSAAGTSFAVTVKVVDTAGQMATQAYTGTVTNGATTLAIATSSVAAPMAGSPYAALIAVTGGVTPYTYSISAGALPAGLSFSTTTGQISGTPTYATAGASFSFTVGVTDSSSQAVSRSYSGTVSAISPALTIVTTSLITPVSGAAYSAGITATNGIAPLTFAVTSGALPSGLTLNTSTGVISGTVPYSAAGVSYVANIRVTDSASQQATQTYSGTVTNGASTLTNASATIPTPTAGSLYATAISVTGGVTPYTFSVSSGALPSGLTLNTASGVISGTPVHATAGTSFVFDITVVDGSTQSVTRTYSGTTGSPAVLAIATTTITTPTAGSSYQNTIAGTGGVPPYTFAVTSGALPSGLSLSAAGVLSGTPTFASRNASFAFGVTVTDAASRTAQQSYNGIISDYTLSLVPTTLVPPLPGSYYTGTVLTVGGQSPYTYALSTGTLPSGLTLNTSTGVISGTVADAEAGGNRNVTIGVTDANGATTSRAYTISTVSFAVTVTTSSLANATESAPYTNAATALAASGGTGPYTYEFTGALPTGVGLTSSGSFFGTPASGQGALSAGTAYPIQVRVRDANRAVSAAVTLTLNVQVSVPTMTAATLTTAVLGSTYSVTVAASGGRSPYTYSLSGTLPTGLSLNTSTGNVSGIATASATCPAAQFAIVVTDVLAQSSSATVKQCIPTANGIVFANSSLANAYEGVAYSNGSTALSASGGTGPYTYSYSGTLPSGVGLTSGGVFFGTPASGQGSVAGIAYPIFVQAKDSLNVVSLPVALTLNTLVNMPVVGAAAASGAVLGTPYSFSLTATGGRPAYSFAVSGGTLPTGLSMSSAGVISGTPTGSSTCPANQFSVTATDALAQVSASVNKCIATGNGINITNTSFPTITIGTNYNATVTVSGGTAPYSFNATSLPSGVVINATTGVMSGFTNAASGDYTGFIVVTDSSATPLSTTRSVDFHVRDALALATSTLPRAAAKPGAGVAYTTTVAATGGLTPITYSLSTGVLPWGLTLSSGGVISGSPTYNSAVGGGVYNFGIKATDSAGATVTQSFTINVSVAPAITNANLGTAVVGTPFAVDVQRVGGANPFIGAGNIASQLTWSATGLPTGLSIGTTNGRISGTPSGSAGTYPVVVSITDAYNFTTQKTLNLRLASAGKTLELKSARFSEPCLANNTNCDPRAHAIGKLTNNAQQFVAYSRNDVTPKSIQIARIDTQGRIPIASATTSSINVVLPANIATVYGMQMADLDQDGKLDILFADTTGKQVCALWNAGTVDTIGMPTGFASTSMNCWAIPNGGDAGNGPYSLTVAGNLRPDSTNFGKQDVIVTVSQSGGAGNSIVVMLNSCVANGACTGSRATLFSGYIAPTGTTTAASNVITSVPSTAGVAVGMQIVGLGIPAGTTVSSFVTNTSITMSANATLSNAGVALSLPTAATTTATTTSASAVLTSVASTTGVVVGMSISGTGIPAGATVQSFVTNTSITISQAATATAGGVTITSFGPSLITPQIIAAASSKMTWLYEVGYGYFNAAAPNPPTTYATGATTCPSLVTAAFQASATANGYAYVMRQNFSGGVCQGDFQLHGANDEQFVTNGTPFLDAVAVSDYNNDGISDIAVGIGTNNQVNSASIRVYLMPGGATFTGATTISPQLQSLNGQYVGAAKIIPYCVNGAASCSYPSLLVTCDRAYYMGRLTGYACMSILPNQCSTPSCTTAFEASTPTARIDYPAPYGQNRDPIALPLVSTSNLTPTGNTTSGSAVIASVSSTTGVAVGQMISGSGIAANAYVTAFTGSSITMSQNATITATSVALTLPAIPTLNDIVMMGVDTTGTEPYFLTYARNGSSTTDPFKSGLSLNGFPSSYLEAGEVGTMKLADLNSDGSPDLVAYLVNQGAVSTYMSATSGSPTYSLGTTLAPNYLSNPNYAGCPSGASSCLPDPIFNTMGAIHGFPATVGAWHMQNTLDVMDINNDGIPDQAVVGYVSRGVAVSLGTASGVLGASALYDVGTSGDIKPQAVAFGDFDQDGVVDIAVASINTTGTQTSSISWLRGAGDGSFETAQPITGVISTCNDPRSISAQDLDGDGRPELAFLCYQSQPQTVWVTRRHTNGTWIAQTGPTINPSGGNNGTVMKWGRLTSTTGLDLVVAGLDTVNSMRIITGVTATVTSAATGSFTLSSTAGTYIQLFGYASDIDIADLNGDGYGDIVAGMQSQNSSGGQIGEIFYTCQSTGTGTCVLRGWGMEGYQTSSVVAGDVNADGLPDVFVGYRANSPGIQRMIYRTVGRTMNSSY